MIQPLGKCASFSANLTSLAADQARPASGAMKGNALRSYSATRSSRNFGIRAVSCSRYAFESSTGFDHICVDHLAFERVHMIAAELHRQRSGAKRVLLFAVA